MQHHLCMRTHQYMTDKIILFCKGLLFTECVCSFSVFDLANNKLCMNPLTLVIVSGKLL